MTTGQPQFAFDFRPSMPAVIDGLNDIKKGLGKNVLQAALREATKPVEQTARTHAPTLTGKMKKSIVRKRPSKRTLKRWKVPETVAAVVVTATKKKADGDIFSRARLSALFHTKTSRLPLIPFIDQAMRAHEDEVLDNYVKAILPAIDKRLAKLSIQ